MKFTALFCLICCLVGYARSEIEEKDKFVQKQSQTNVHHIYNSCDASDCKGVKGPKGPRGLRGFKGEKGYTAPLTPLNKKIATLEKKLAVANARLNAIPKYVVPDLPLSAYCYMGMRNLDIPNSHITASTSFNKGSCNVKQGRLDNLDGAWCAQRRDAHQWIQADFGVVKSVAGVVTQGRLAASQWVKSFKVSCGITLGRMAFVKNKFSNDVIYTGNWDMDTKVFSLFPAALKCRYVRIHPLTWNRHNSMRVEFISGKCLDLYKKGEHYKR